jgi:hypothetical protein
LSARQKQLVYEQVCTQTQRRLVGNVPDHASRALTCFWDTYSFFAEAAHGYSDWIFPCKQTLCRLSMEYHMPYQAGHRKDCFASRTLARSAIADPVTAAAVLAAIENQHSFDSLSLAGFHWDFISGAHDHDSFDLVRDVVGLESALCSALQNLHLTLDACLGWSTLRRTWIQLALVGNPRTC